MYGRGERNVPLRAPWKKNRTTNTCSPAMETIINPSITLKFQIRRSVLRTVLKLRFSRVRKYFWLREMVDSWAESLKMDSSMAEACSGLAPWREGSSARDSFSSYKRGTVSGVVFAFPRYRGKVEAHRDLKVNHLLRERGHFIVEAEPVFANALGRENKVSLTFLGAI